MRHTPLSHTTNWKCLYNKHCYCLFRRNIDTYAWLQPAIQLFPFPPQLNLSELPGNAMNIQRYYCVIIK